jgi:hypothetical protein
MPVTTRLQSLLKLCHEGRLWANDLDDSVGKVQLKLQCISALRVVKSDDKTRFVDRYGATTASFGK